MSWAAILTIADRLEPQMRRAFLAAVEQLRGRVDVDAIAEAIVDGRVLDADLLLAAAAEPLADDLRDASTLMTEALQQAGHTAAIRFRGSIAFDITNPFAIDAARLLAAEFVTGVGVETKAALNAIIVRAFEDGLTRRQVSALIRPLIGLTRGDAIAVLNYRAELVRIGTQAAVVDREGRRYADRLLRERAATIARTEIMRASNEGQIALWRQAQQRGLLGPGQRRKWTVTPDDRLCPRCLAFDQKTAKLDEPFTSRSGETSLGPPLHPRCRCVPVLVIITR